MRSILAAAALALAGEAQAAQPGELLAGYEAEARAANRAFIGFSAARGERFFGSRHGGEWSCSSCHGAAPTTPGKHVRTDKTIAPLAPAANPGRFTDRARVEKWFRRNCNDVLGRACTPAEKGDVLAYLLEAR